MVRRFDGSMVRWFKVGRFDYSTVRDLEGS